MRDFLRDPAGALAARVFAELRPLYPDGSMIKSLASHFEVEWQQVAAAAALLQTVDAVDVQGEPGPGLAVRINRGMVK